MLVRSIKWRKQNYDSCWWRISIPDEYNYKEASLIIKFNKAIFGLVVDKTESPEDRTESMKELGRKIEMTHRLSPPNH